VNDDALLHHRLRRHDDALADDLGTIMDDDPFVLRAPDARERAKGETENHATRNDAS
jgi:hypothetical protein